MAYAYNPSPGEPEAKGSSWVQDQPRLQSKILVYLNNNDNFKNVWPGGLTLSPPPYLLTPYPQPLLDLDKLETETIYTRDGWFTVRWTEPGAEV